MGILDKVAEIAGATDNAGPQALTMPGLHQRAAQRAAPSRIAFGSVLMRALVLALSACTITPWHSAESGGAEEAAHTGVAAAVPTPAVAASALPATGPATDAAPGFYRVKPGDTLYRVAKAYGQRPADLVSWNQLPADGKIQTGRLLRVGPPAVAAGASAVPATSVASAPLAASASKPAGAPAKARFIWPIEGSVAQPFKGKSKGVVIAGPAGQQVKAAASGRVVYAGSGMKAYGKLVIVKHDAHLVTAYGRNGKLLVKEGDTVKQGQAIAASGTDGAGISALIFEVRKNGKPVDPLAWLPKAQP